MRVFVTGASGHLGSAVVPELLAAGHEVLGLARSERSAAAVTALGATVRRGEIDDLDGLKEAAAAADGVVHLAFKHDLMLSGDMAGAIAAELTVIEAFGEALAGSGKPFVMTSGTALLGRGGLGRPLTEDDVFPPGGRADAENAALALAERGVRSAALRLPPVTHGELDAHGFALILIGIARQKGVSGYAGDGANRWPAVHTLDAARLYRLALEQADPGTRWNATGDEGVEVGEIARRIGEHLGVPTASIPDDELQAHFGFLSMLIGLDMPASSHLTRRVLGWEPTHPGLLEDLDKGFYFEEPAARG
jgi:nucleoside-diphosphate-sugar epimerase